MIANSTRNLRMIEERGNVLLLEIVEIGAKKQPVSCFYVVKWDRERAQVRDAIPADAPADGGYYFASGYSPASVSYVAGGRAYATARKWFNRLAPRA